MRVDPTRVSTGAEYTISTASGRTFSVPPREGRPPKPLPQWTELAHEKCPCCPLAATPGARCPAALALLPVVAEASDLSSTEEVDVSVRNAGRSTAKHTSLQEALGSLVGLLMPLSGCPVTAPLAPLARQHLPFATPAETLLRVAGLFAVRQRQSGSTDPWVDELRRTYADLGALNRAFSRRLRSACKGDASVNALVKLFSLGVVVTDELDSGFTALAAESPSPAGGP